MPDLVTGYDAGAGGAFTLRRGNIDLAYPNTPAAQERSRKGTPADASFLAATGYARVPARPDLLGAGDFDGDSHFDVVAAERGGRVIFLFAGDGAGNFSEPREVALPDGVTALVAGEMNQADGLADIAVAVEGPAGARLLIFEGPAGALNSEPEVLALPAASRSMALGQLDAESAFDLAAAAGPWLVVFHGRNRQLTQRAAARQAVAPARIERVEMAEAVKSVAIGDFEAGRADEIALLTEGGAVRILSPHAAADGGAQNFVNDGESDTANNGAGVDADGGGKSYEGDRVVAQAAARLPAREEVPAVASWRRAEVAGGAWPGAAMLAGAKVSAYPGQDLLLLDAAGRELHLLVGDKLDAPSETGSAETANAPARAAADAEDKGARASLEPGGQPVAVLPMLLDADGLHDLVILTADEFDPAVALTGRPVAVRLGGRDQGVARSGAAAAPGGLRPVPLSVRDQILGKSGDVLGQGGGAAAAPAAGGGKQGAAPKRVEDRPTANLNCPAAPINFNTTVNGALGPGDCFFTLTGEFFDAYTFAGQAGQRVAITLASPAFDTFLYLLGPDEMLYAVDDDGGGLTNSRIPGLPADLLTLPFNGQYTILASSYRAGAAGPYQLSLARGASVCEPVPLSVASNGVSVLQGALADGDCRLPNGAYGDWFSFNAVAGQQVSITLSAGLFDPVIHLRAPDGTLIAFDDNYLSHEAVLPPTGNFLRLNQTGTYVILASSFSARSAGPYDLTLVFNTTPCRFDPITYGSPVITALTTDDPCGIPFSDGTLHTADLYTFIGRAGDIVAVEMFSSAFPSFVRLIAPDDTFVQGGAVAPGFTARAPAAGFVLLPASGIYVIQTASASSFIPSQFGPYQVTLLVQTGSTVVTTAEDNGDNEAPTPGSLRQAILHANANPGPDTIRFNIPTAAKTIRPIGALPAVAGTVTIDGTTQPGYAGTPLIELNGELAGSQAVGLKLVGSNSRVRGLAINRFGSAAVGLTGLGNHIVEGNHIGTDPTGQLARPYGAPAPGDLRSSDGILIESSRNNTVGGTTAAARNVISGNRNVGVVIERSFRVIVVDGNRILGNHIGTNAAGAAAVGNGGNGVVVLTGFNNVVGGTTAGSRNVISGNGATGIGLGSWSLIDGNLVQGNFVGTNAAGTAALGNRGGGILVGGALERDAPYLESLVIAVNNLVGGTTAAARNVVSGNREGSGVDVINTNSDNNRVQGNFIGTNAAGTAALPNEHSGVMITLAPGNVIGGATPGAGNVIAGNLQHGIGVGLPDINPLTQQVIAGIKGVDIIGNFIGTNSANAPGLGNRFDGILIAAAATDNLVKDNTIAFNSRNGINIPDVTPNSSAPPGLRNRLTGNRIFGNGLLGIDLHTPGITENDPGDLDGGANLQQNFPEQLTLVSVAPAAPAAADDAASPSAVSVVVQGRLRSRANTTYTVEWFLSADRQCNADNESNSAVLLPGKLTTRTDASGVAVFPIGFTFPGALTEGTINSTATPDDGTDEDNTSEFSRCLFVSSTACPVPATVSPTSAPVGGSVQIGGQNLTGVTGVRFAGGAAGVITANTGTQLTVTVPAGAQSGPLTLSKAGCGDVLTPAFTILQNNPAPALATLAPATAAAGTAAFTLTVNGSNFVGGAAVRWNGADRPTTFVSAARLTASISAADIAGAGARTVVVFNPAPGGGVSNTLNFTVAGACSFSLGATGQNLAAAGGAGSLGVTAGAGCPWTAVSNSPWLTVTAGASSTGSNTVQFAVAPNTAAGRVGKITAAGQTFTVMQAAAAGCATAVYPPLRPFGAGGGGGRATAIAAAPCAWAVTSDAAWITVTSGGGGSGTGRVRYTVASNTGATTRTASFFVADQNYTVTQTATATTPTVQFTSASFPASENAPGRAAQLTVTRQGDTAGGVTVEYATQDNPAEVPCNPQETSQRGTAYARCDYATTVETLTFAPGETSKTIAVPLVNDTHFEGLESFTVALSNPAGATLGAVPTATVNLTDDETVAGAFNSIFTSQFFVRVQYLDFLSREPEVGEPWTGVLDRCPNPENGARDFTTPSAGCDLILVSKSFFESDEFRLKGRFVFLYHKVAFGSAQNPNYFPEYRDVVADMRRVTGATPPETVARRLDFSEDFVSRSPFAARYGAVSNQDFVATLLSNVGVVPTLAGSGFTRDSLVAELNAGAKTRADVLRVIVESPQVDAAQFNQVYVAMQYYGYLRRTPELSGYLAWLAAINPPRSENPRVMVDGFMNSTEYRWRFGRSNR